MSLLTGAGAPGAKHTSHIKDSEGSHLPFGLVQVSLGLPQNADHSEHRLSPFEDAFAGATTVKDGRSSERQVSLEFCFHNNRLKESTDRFLNTEEKPQPKASLPSASNHNNDCCHATVSSCDASFETKPLLSSPEPDETCAETPTSEILELYLYDESSEESLVTGGCDTDTDEMTDMATSGNSEAGPSTRQSVHSTRTSHLSMAKGTIDWYGVDYTGARQSYQILRAVNRFSSGVPAWSDDLSVDHYPVLEPINRLYRDPRVMEKIAKVYVPAVMEAVMEAVEDGMDRVVEMTKTPRVQKVIRKLARKEPPKPLEPPSFVVHYKSKKVATQRDAQITEHDLVPNI